MNRLRVAIIAMTMVATAFAAPSTANAVDHSRGHAGFCKTSKGVTVVVDFGKLGGTTIVRCNPSANPGTGLDALKGAGFQITGVQRWGESFICRIENRPSASESVPIQGNANYKEKCLDTPPAAGYWSYWHAGNNCAWQYSQWGVKNRAAIAGGFEGWSFSLNASADNNPRPRIATVRPGTSGQRCNAPNEGAPSGNSLSEQQPGLNGSADGPNSAESEGLPAPKPRPETKAPKADDPADNVEFTGGEDAQNVSSALQEQSRASRYAPWAAAGVLVILGLGMWWTARRRRRLREN